MDIMQIVLILVLYYAKGNSSDFDNNIRAQLLCGLSEHKTFTCKHAPYP